QSGASPRGPGPAFGTWYSPWIDPASYQTPGAIGRTLIRSAGDGGRYMTFDPATADREPKGFLYHQSPPNWPAYANGRSVLFGLSEIQGYSPVQLLRYWSYLRTLDRNAPIYYNAATFQSDGEQVLDLFGVEWVIEPSSLSQPPPNGVVAAHEGDWTLFRINDPSPRASFIPNWRVSSPTGALNDIVDPNFPQGSSVALEQTPRVDGHPVPGSADEIDM